MKQRLYFSPFIWHNSWVQVLTLKSLHLLIIFDLSFKFHNIVNPTWKTLKNSLARGKLIVRKPCTKKKNRTLESTLCPYRNGYYFGLCQLQVEKAGRVNSSAWTSAIMTVRLHGKEETKALPFSFSSMSLLSEAWSLNTFEFCLYQMPKKTHSLWVLPYVLSKQNVKFERKTAQAI